MQIIDDVISLVSGIFGRKENQDFLTWTPNENDTRQKVLAFLESEPDWVANAISHDPALSSKPNEDAVEELLTYQGLHAIAWHRKAHDEYEKGNFGEARKISQGVRRLTAGIEIHPGATIGKNFFIDHGSGVVIGETAEIGDNVMLYHRVTLGNDGRNLGGRRHPKIGNDTIIYTGAEVLGAATIGDNVVIGAGTKIFGPVHIGNNAKIGPQLVITTDIPENAKVIATYPDGTPKFASSASEMDYQHMTLPAWQSRMKNPKPTTEASIAST